jgi:5-methylcytosine-specific restriction endonuclease McrA
MAINARLRFAVLNRDGFTCQYCGRSAPGVTLEVDHIQPRSRGGRSRRENLTTACRDCNRGKYSTTLTAQDIIPPARLAFLIGRNLLRNMALSPTQ